ncbi:MAG: hypothetical protein COV01_02670 [Candidatus Taylorbacteria bacterium CG10_big_fil_rev_8_21_14_0_10_41_48]|uniref:Uncharacterized protein n=1 Tax=Candidatus Taylorbacteria bacterium CG10_big_fil_rev_8_21_14_0_10_41_48 TaxID=1975024 RepID=A0A2M8LBM5_9BACT|nr:MAG: hypothetical protein COV01_02670 [Candidatus Taylorbacteria bacterium CG10_big_fil_rev_8_21_14_0_10_41_48]
MALDDFFHSLVDIFVQGYSPIRIYVFIGVIGVLFLLSLTKRSFSGDKEEGLLIGALSGVFLIGFLYEVYISLVYKVGIFKSVLFLNGNEMTSSSVFHNHILKGVIGYVTSFLSSGFESLDPGIGILPFVSPWVLLLVGIVFVYCLFLIGRISIRLFGDITDSKNSFIFAYGLILSTVIIRLFDGGIWAMNSVLFLGLLYLIISKKERFIINSIYLLLLQLAVYLFSYFKKDFFDLTSAILYSLCAWSLVTLLMSRYLRLDRVKVIYVLFVLLVSIVPIFKMNFFQEDNDNGIFSKVYFSTYETTENEKYFIVDSIGDLNIYMYEDTVDRKLKDLTLFDKKIQVFNYIDIPNKTCSEKSVDRVIGLNILSKEEIVDMFWPNSHVGIEVYKHSQLINDMYLYNVKIRIPACIPREWSVIQEVLNSAGSQKAIIYSR